MKRKIVRTGTSRALVLTREMLAHLDIDENDVTVEVLFLGSGTIVLTRTVPDSWEESENRDMTLYDGKEVENAILQMRRTVRRELVKGVRRKNREIAGIGGICSTNQSPKELDST